MSWLTAWVALTLNIYMEAGGEGYHGMEMVADVTINRLHDDRFPDTVQNVVLQKGQFSWVRKLPSRNAKGLLVYKKRLLASKKLRKKVEWRAFQTAALIADKALRKGYKTHHKYLYFYRGKKPKHLRFKRSYKYKRHHFA
ncbi:endolysin [Aeromonas phage BUCT695]|uniref:endolysin n=1 Tax=Aeromonas phage BUCT695 TaxID=2908630 RepID=UPI0023293191|nr:endolysin [Aeromonas phage BUCT695]UIW10497.1 putative endolysin [Aeromonas phage BUCT695]